MIIMSMLINDWIMQFDFIKRIERGNDILIPSGNDQLDIIKDFQNKVKNINQLGKYDYEISDYQTLLIKLSNVRIYQNTLVSLLIQF